MLSLNYDKKSDTLYLGVGDNSQSYCSDVIKGINVFRDLDSDEVTGFLIFAFMDKYKNSKLSHIPEIPLINFDK